VRGGAEESRKFRRNFQAKKFQAKKLRTKKKGLGVAAKSLFLFGGLSRIRTLDLLIKSQLLYQLS
jgi:hypothetical protein